MKKIIVVIIVMVSGFLSAQNDKAFVEAQVAQKMAELEMQQNPLYFYKMDYCDGNVQTFTLPDGISCTSTTTYYEVYVFWKEAEDVMKFQKFDNCGSFIPFNIIFSRPMNKILEDGKTLKKEVVKPYNKEVVDSANSEIITNEQCHTDYKFVFGGSVFQKSFKQLDLDNDSENKNFKYNSALHLIKLDAEISKLLRAFEADGKFFREK